MEAVLKIKLRCGWQVEFTSPIKAQVFGSFGETIWNDANVIYSGISSSKAWKMLKSENSFLIDFATNDKRENFVVVGPYGLKGGGCGGSRIKMSKEVHEPTTRQQQQQENEQEQKQEQEKEQEQEQEQEQEKEQEQEQERPPSSMGSISTLIENDTDNQISRAIRRLESGISQKQIVEITSALKDLRGLSFKHCITPFSSAKDLLNCLRDEWIWEPNSWIYVRKEIIKMARRLFYVACSRADQNISCFTITKNELSALARSIENKILTTENKFPQNGALSDIKRVQHAIQAVSTEQRWWEGPIGNGIKLLICLANKDYSSAGQLFLNLAKNLSDYIHSGICENSLMLDCLSESAKNLKAYDKLYEFLVIHKDSDTDLIYIILDEIEAVILDESVDLNIRKKFLEGESNEKPGFLNFADFAKRSRFRNNWRIREKVASGLVKISNTKDTYLKNIAKIKLDERIINEKNRKVKYVFENQMNFLIAQKILEYTREECKTPYDILIEHVIILQSKFDTLQEEQQKNNACQVVNIYDILSFLKDLGKDVSETKNSIKELENYKIKSLQLEEFFSNEMKVCLMDTKKPDIDNLNNFSHFGKCPNYEGRPEDVENIWNQIGQYNDQAAKQIAIIGEKGAGKTQVAYEFVEKYKEEFGFIWLINATDKSCIEDSFIKIAIAIGITSTNDWHADVNKQILLVLENQQKLWLLIFDNALNSDLVSEFIPKTNGIALITSIDNNWENFYQLSPYKIPQPEKPRINRDNWKIDDCPDSYINIKRIPRAILPKLNIRQIELFPKPVPRRFEITNQNMPEDASIEIPQPSPPDQTVKGILVAIRIRPISDGECQSKIRFEPNSPLAISDTNNILRSFTLDKNLTFNKIFQNEDNYTIFMNIISANINSVFSSKNSCVIAYGSTGSGKTHTMTGIDKDPGIIFLTLKQIMDNKKENTVTISYIQIYNEEISDLLSNKAVKTPLRADTKEGTKLHADFEHEIENFDDATNLIFAGNAKRHQAFTRHKNSSRSHTALTIKIYKAKTVFIGKILLVDLAGNEKYSDAPNYNSKIEGNNIRKSLLTLGRIIKDLSNDNKVFYWRESKLSRILKGSIGGNCKSVLITNISPYSSLTENKDALEFACNASKIKTIDNIIRNDVDDRTKEELLRIIAELNAKIRSLQTLNIDQNSADLIENINKNLQEWSDIKYKLADLEERIIDCNNDIRSKLGEIEKLNWQEMQNSERDPQILELSKDILDIKKSLDEKKKEKEETENKLNSNQAQLERIKTSINAEERHNGSVLAAALQCSANEQEKQELYLKYERLYKKIKKFVQDRENQNNNSDLVNLEFEEINEIEQAKYDMIMQFVEENNNATITVEDMEE